MGQYLLKLFEKFVGVYYLNYRVYSVSQSINQSVNSFNFSRKEHDWEYSVESTIKTIDSSWTLHPKTP